ncbi:MAG: Arylsulfatase [Anaerocolumna sp.]|nr:Arylsulfatase [Anaerocolumna sp.]
MFKISNPINRKNTSIVHKYRIFQIIFFALCITLMIEILSRRSIINGIVFVFANPIIFLFNMLIVMLTLSLSFLFARRQFSLIAISVVWLGLGIANGVVLCFRLTPLSAMDFYNITPSTNLVPGYLNIALLILIGIIFLLLVSGIALLWRKAQKDKLPWKISLPTVFISGILLFLISFTATKMNVLSNHFDNLHDAYKEYGFVYCFSNSILDRGIDKPLDYSSQKIEEVLENIDASSNQLYKGDEKNVEAPNIIMIQLESFFDTSLLKNYEFSENPVPNYTKLKQEFTSGYLTVPVYGAGTVNTEFEVITGMSSGFFGTGEYPYRTILASKTCESICYNLSKLGYHNYVIHNNAASFYKRNEVFKMLGFDNFVSMEYMNGIELNPIGWAKDNVLTQEILKALNAKDTKDFIYTISVQDHGIYPDSYKEESQKINVSLKPDLNTSINKEKTNESYINKLKYYVNQVNDTDKFIGELTHTLSEFEEPTVVVFYGDHLPPLSFENEDLNNDRYETEYVMWSNFSMEKERHDLTAYQLNAYVLERLGINEGILTQFHQTNSNSPSYEEQLKLLQYDMLYGKRYVYEGKNPYPVKDMKMGIYNQVITDIETTNNKIYVYGENFTPWSRICINDKLMVTKFINNTTLCMEARDISDKEICVAQVTDSNSLLSKSDLWKYTAD